MGSIKVIAESAFSHEGERAYLLNTVQSLYGIPCDLVKLQVCLTSEHSIEHPMASKIAGLMLVEQDWREAVSTIKDQGKIPLLLPVDLQALNWILEERLSNFLEIHPVNLFRKDFFKTIANSNFKGKIFLGTSGYSFEEVQFIVREYQSLKDCALVLMHGFQSFPTDPSGLDLARIRFLKESFNCSVGYADHTFWSENCEGLVGAAIGLGAKYIEKHVVLEQGVDRIDYESALGPLAFEKLVTNVRDLDKAVNGQPMFSLSDAEYRYGRRRLRLVADRDIAQGDRLELPMARYKWSTDLPSENAVVSFRKYGTSSDRSYGQGAILD